MKPRYDCIILAGGMGTRLQSVVADKPKCLADIAGKPFLFYMCEYLKRFSIHQVIFSVGYKKEMVIEYVQNHLNDYPFPILFAEEEEPLGTGGAILNALQYAVTDDVFILNGDTFFEVDLDNLYEVQKSKMSDCTLALKPMKIADRYGLVHLDEDDRITHFEEKKPNTQGLINGGVYCLFRNAYVNIPFAQLAFSFEKAFLENMIQERNFYGLELNHYFIDIGIPEDYARAQTEIPDCFSS